MKSGYQGSLSRHHGKLAFPAGGGKVPTSSQAGAIDNQRSVERTPGPGATRADRIVHVLDFGRIEVYEAGASLVTVLAHPGENDARSEDIRKLGRHTRVLTFSTSIFAVSSRIRLAI